MRIFRRRVPTQRTDPQPEPFRFDIDVAAVVRDEIARGDIRARPVLERLFTDRVALSCVTQDCERGSATLTFTDGTRITVATTSPEVPQLAAAVRLVDTRLARSHLESRSESRILIFSGAPWTTYLNVGAIHV